MLTVRSAAKVPPASWPGGGWELDPISSKSLTKLPAPNWAAGRRNRDVQDLVAVARRADAGLRTANALRAGGRGGSRQGLVDSQERVLDSGRKGVAAGVCARRIEDSEIERLNPGTVLHFGAQRRRSPRFH